MNLAASGLVGFGLYNTFYNTAINETAQNVADAKLNINYMQTPINGIMCGMCVKKAVSMFSENRMKPKGIFYLAFFVTMFVFYGFEHCIANMFYFACANAWKNKNMYINLALVIAGNTLGSWLV